MTTSNLRVSHHGNFTSTGSTSGNFICSWKLNDFSKLDCSPGDLYASRCTHDRVGNYESWYLKIFPGGDNTKNEGFVSFYLCSHINYEEKIKVLYTVELRNATEKILKTEISEQTNFGLGWGYPKLIERKTLLPELIEDVLVIQVDVFYTQTFVTRMSGKTEHYPELNSELICNDIGRFQTENRETDVVISVGEADIPAHYAILAARSVVFAAMFEHDTIEKRSRRVSITDFDVDSVEALLQFLYNGTIASLTIDLAKDLLRAADKYDMDDLMIYCSNYMISRFDVENVASILVAADMHNANKLRAHAIRFICDKKRDFDFEKYLPVFISHGRLLLDVMKGLTK